MTRILVTGASSFTARHLLPLLGRRPEPVEVTTTDAHGRSPAEVPHLVLDLRDRAAVRDRVRAIAPQLVFHLAGVSSADADECFAVNLGGTRHLLEAVAALPTPPRTLVVSSAAVYGLTSAGSEPLTEEAPLRPVSDYGASKAAAEMLALSMHRRGLVPVVVARPFNLLGPGLQRGFAASDFLAQALAVRGGGPPEIRVGNLEPRRDLIDVRDAVRAYAELVERDDLMGGVFNVASGRGLMVRELLERVLRTVGVEARVIVDPARRRPVEVLDQVGDPGALARATGWAAEIPLERSLADMASAERAAGPA